MKQSVLVGPGRSRVVERPTPQPGESDVVVRVGLCGVCASELPLWRSGSGEMMEGARETALGHEIVGTVAAVGAKVQDLEIGERVTGWLFRGFAEFVMAPRSHVVRIPDSLSDEAAIGEPLACAMSAARRTAIDLGDRVAIVGLGYMGLLFLMAARHRGAREIVAIDLRAEARSRALTLGADRAYSPDDVEAHWRLTRFDEIAKGHGFDVVVEASGHPSGLSLASEITRAHGVLSIFGYHQDGPRQVDMQMWNWKALEVLNAHERRQDYLMDSMRRGLELATAGRFDPGPLVTHRYTLDAVDEAFSMVDRKPSGFVKAVIAIGTPTGGYASSE